jgi:hypothetical protein
VAEDIHSAAVDTPAVVDTLEEDTRAAAATAGIAKFSRQVFHAVQLLECCRFDVDSELM